MDRPLGELFVVAGSLLAVGFVTGRLAGLVGIGGGGILMPVLYEPGTPLVVVVEDLHWIDPHSEEVIRLLLEGIATVPVLTLLTRRLCPALRRPDLLLAHHAPQPARRPDGRPGRPLQAAEVPAAARELIVRKTEGNPLFVEELTRALVEEGTLQRANGGYRLARVLDDVHIPDTIQGVIMARIDRLPDDPGIQIEHLLPALRIPTLVLHGDEDRYTFKGRGHALYATATAEFIQVVRGLTGSDERDRSGSRPIGVRRAYWKISLNRFFKAFDSLST